MHTRFIHCKSVFVKCSLGPIHENVVPRIYTVLNLLLPIYRWMLSRAHHSQIRLTLLYLVPATT